MSFPVLHAPGTRSADPRGTRDPARGVRPARRVVLRRVGLTALSCLWWIPLTAGSLAAQSCNDRARAVEAAVHGGALALADSLIAESLPVCPRHPELLSQGASLRFVQGRYVESEALVTRFLAEEPDSSWGLELLGSLRYVQDDVPGALAAWNPLGRPRLRWVTVSVADEDIQAPAGKIGIRHGDVITHEGLHRSVRRLGDLPAVHAARLSLRPLPGGEADLTGTALLHASHPFGRIHLPAHGLRALRGEARLAGAGLPGAGPGPSRTGGWSRWMVVFRREGELRTGFLQWSHPLPLGSGVVKWKLEGQRGRWGDATMEAQGPDVWEERRWTATSTLLHRPWAPVRAGLAVGWSQRRSERSGPVAGLRVDLDPGPWRIGLRVDGGRANHGWARMDTELRRTFLPASAWELEPRAGVVALSRNAPLDLQPRFGADRAATHLMRAGRAVDREGVVRPPAAGPRWLLGGLELRRFGQGPLTRTVGAAVFLDALRGSGSTEPVVHAGLGVRLRPGPATNGTATAGSDEEDGLRVDLARDLREGGWRLSAAWRR
jgi:hypothetical protein